MVRKSYNSGSYVAYTYNAEGSLARLSYGDSTGELASYRFEYDSFGRLTRSEVALNSSAIYTTAYAFRDLDASRTTTQVQYRNVRSANGKMLEGKKYTYDALGNITRISQSTKPFYTLVAYEYDAQNQLTKETYYNGNGTAAGNITRTISYTYDTAGNILSVTETAGDKTTTKAYTYGDSEWLDLLTAINGSAIRYDAGGNPTNWSNGKADLSLQWANGRRLTGASSESATKSESLSYAYDADGVRTSKSYTVKTYNVIPDYVVTFVADGKTVKTMTVEQGYKLKDSDYPTVPAKTGYTGEWKKYTTAISTDVTVVAVYTKIAARHTVTFKADGVVLKTMTVKTGYTLNPIDYPAIPAKEGYIGSWPTKKGRVIRADTVISAIYKSTGGGGITVPTRPSGEIMSVDEIEPIEAEAAEENAVATRGTHLASTQTVTHEYLTQSGKVMRETIKTNQTVTAVLDFIYDESGKPFAMIDQLSAQPKTYYYVLNLQGDVVKLIDQDGAVAAAYAYDAWGNILSQSGSMADVNPLRYRGYYYDSETGFYYLQSRYYDPTNHRFINADSYATTGQGLLGTNMFAYCRNSPVIRIDLYGKEDVTIEIPLAVNTYIIQADARIFATATVSLIDEEKITSSSYVKASLSPEEISIGGVLSCSVDLSGITQLSLQFDHDIGGAYFTYNPVIDAYIYSFYVKRTSPDEKSTQTFRISIKVQYNKNWFNELDAQFSAALRGALAKVPVGGATFAFGFTPASVGGGGGFRRDRIY